MGVRLLGKGSLPAFLCCLFVLNYCAAGSFVNFESPHVSPMALSPDGNTLAVCNTPDNHVWLYDVSSGTPVFIKTVPVGMDPVSARFRTNNELWVVNHISDSVSVVSVSLGAVTNTLSTRTPPAGAFAPGTAPRDFGDEPCDVVFAGTPQRAYISCSQSNVVVIANPTDIAGGLTDFVSIDGEDPRALAVSPDGTKVYAAIFESGNNTTIMGGGSDSVASFFPPNIVGTTGPYSGANPPPNTGGVGGTFTPALNGANPTAPKVGLIVKKTGGAWMDDNGQNWSTWVDGASAAASGRPVGWTLYDNDVAEIDTANSNAVTYITSLMNLCMAMGVNPNNGDIAVVGTEATNEIRFEPNITGTFTRVNIGITDDANFATKSIVDLNAHLGGYGASTLAQTERDKSLGDPRGIVWNSVGTKAYITGMGSNNVIVINNLGARNGLAQTIEVQEGPTGLALDESNNRLYVLNKFHSSISVINTTTELEIANVPMFDPSSDAIKTGRKHLYDTHKNSGLGQIACASCHIDSRMDRLAWDLGDPGGEMKDVDMDNPNKGAGISTSTNFTDYHPMKGPMTTQTLQDIIGKEPLHWRGDRFGIEEFNGAFIGLQGDDTNLTNQEMQEFENFLATLHFPPNPFRNLDNTLPTDMPMPGHFFDGRHGVAGTQLPNSNPRNGLVVYRNDPVDNQTCVSCHTLPLGNGGDKFFTNPGFADIPLGPNGQNHVAIVSVDQSSQRAFKTPQLMNSYDKVGFEMTTGNASRAGFGYLHDGSIDSISRFLSEGVFNGITGQELSDLVGLVLCFSGGFEDDILTAMGHQTLQADEFPLQQANDAHAAVGVQVSLSGASNSLLDSLLSMAQSGKIDLVAKGLIGGQQRGWALINGNINFFADRMGFDDSLAVILSKVDGGTQVTFTAVPAGSGKRIGVDHDGDDAFDYNEFLAGTNPLDPLSAPMAAADASGWMGLVLLALMLGFVGFTLFRRVR
jgi:YVTN family beta-propeller protein